MKTLGNQQKILELLKKLSGLDPLKQLFWTELNYKRINKSLSRRNWGEKTTTALADDPLLLAAGGANDDFHVIYAKLASDKLLLTQERAIVANLLKEHPYALFVISNREQELWHFINVKYGPDAEKRRQFRRITVGKDERLRTASERISMLDLASLSDELFGIPPLTVQERHDEAFDVEAITRVFYDEYEAVFNILQDDLGKKTKDKKWAHDYSLRFLNRCMFLYFIQRKGWLGKDKEFLRTFWEAYNHSGGPKDSFVDTWLNVLFFEAFNNKFHSGHRQFPKDIRDSLSLFPYLNGGLFSPNKELDDRYNIEISDKRFEQIFIFFERYNFTIAEDSPLDKEVAVDPEMIGKVYESLVNVKEISPDQRSAAGIFYTPRIEIDLMCRLALVDNFANQMGEENKNLLNQLIYAYEPDEKAAADAAFSNAKLWPSLISVLNEITIVDPACGSGSFLVGMLYVLDDMYRRAEKQLGIEENPFERKKRIIGQSLYGVDVMDWACGVAELRLWLALVIDADFAQEDLHLRHEPLLPNFSFNIRCGDSLVQEMGGIAIKNLHSGRGTAPVLSSSIRAKITLLNKEKIKFYKNEPDREIMTLSDAKKLELRLFREILDDYSNKLAKELDEKKKRIAKPVGRQIRLDGRIEDISAQQTLDYRGFNKQIEKLAEELIQIKEAKSRLSSIRDVPFIWEIAFVEIFGGEKKGFDIVIGNPPYVRQEHIADPELISDEVTAENKKIYKAKLARSVYQAFPSFFGYKPASDMAIHKIDAKSDLYIYFYFHGLSLLNQKGSFCFITSNSWLDVGYGKDMQEFLLKHAHIKLILDNQANRSFAQADVNTIIALLSAPTENEQWGQGKIAKFVMFKVPFEHILSSIIFSELDEARDKKSTPEYRVFPISQKALLEEGWEWPEETSEEEKEKFGFLAKDSQYGGNKWGSKYLRAPEIYWRILEKGRGKLRRLGDIAEVRFGIKTGANEFFYLDEAKIAEWGIEEEFLVPIIKSPRECKRIQIDTNGLKYRAFMCDKTKADLKKTAAIEYIKWGEAERINKRPSCRNRPKWWELPKISGNTFWGKEIREKIGAFCSYQLMYADCRLYAASCELWLQAILNSTLTIFFSEIMARDLGGGGGPRSMMVYEVQDLLVVERGMLKANDDYLEEAFKELGQQDLIPFTEDLNNPARLRLDHIVFEALGLTSDERKTIYKEAANRIITRLLKAESLEGIPSKSR